jgi:hypothetical protein
MISVLQGQFDRKQFASGTHTQFSHPCLHATRVALLLSNEKGYTSILIEPEKQLAV